MKESTCYCGSHKDYKDCCQVFLTGLSKPETPEQLMRSRYAAFYKTNEMGQLHERSKFIREAGQWYYLDGEYMDPLVFGRNDPCWCGSNKKHKRCHGR